jgi:circadian clock protein KaiC
MGVFPEFAIVDGIIYLGAPRRELSVERQIEVRKLRGAAYESGVHFFTINSDGLTFYPRVKAPPPEEVSPSLFQDRAATGAAGLDEMLGGGFPRLTSTMIEGGTGTGKTVFSLQYIVEGARRGEPGLYLTLEETPSQLRALGNVFGWNIAELESKDLITISYASPVELSTDAYLNQARGLIEKTGARRAVLDSLSSLQLGVISERRFKELVYAVTRHFNAAGVTFLTTMEIPELLGSTQLTGLGTSSMSDNIIMLRYVESGGRLDHALSVLKARGIAHDTQVRRYAIASGNGFTVGEPFQRLRGVLTGIPVPTDETK